MPKTPLRRASRLPRCASVLGAAAVFFMADAGRADIYQSTDANGVVTFSNTSKKGALYTKESKPKASVPSVERPGDSGRYDSYIREAATLYQIPEALIRAVIKVESGFDPRAVSRANARGLMQLIPATAERMMVTDIFDPRQNIFGGVRYLRVLANLFNGDLELTLAGYNAGESAVVRYGGIPPYEETQAYVVKVVSYYRQYRSEPSL